MADASFVIKLLTLRPGRFGHPKLARLPYGGMVGSNHHNVATTAVYPVGTIIKLFNSDTGYVGGDTIIGTEGWSEFVYGQFKKDSGETLAATDVVMPLATTNPFEFTGDPDVCASGAAGVLAVIALSTMTNDYYGWFWSGGVCPTELITTGFATSATVATDDSVTAGQGVMAAFGNDISSNTMGLKIANAAFEPIGTAMGGD